jgi:2-dehydro-3-deoxyphosphogluconate aldolase / (4S)-4-hydroxy-2-oxoglutarate aldolase
VILEDRLLSIVRVSHADDVVAETLATVGLRAVEVSLVCGNALAAITTWRDRFDGQLVIGAGTVVSRHDAEHANDAGSRYLVSPGFDGGVAECAREAGVLYIPGAFTPTEVQRALASGITLVKLFPAARLGPAYVRDLLGPFPSVQLLATGGIDEKNARAFLDAGAAAVAVGGALVRERRPQADLAAAAVVLLGMTRPRHHPV